MFEKWFVVEKCTITQNNQRHLPRKMLPQNSQDVAGTLLFKGILPRCVILTEGEGLWSKIIVLLICKVIFGTFLPSEGYPFGQPQWNRFRVVPLQKHIRDHYVAIWWKMERRTPNSKTIVASNSHIKVRCPRLKAKCSYSHSFHVYGNSSNCD